MCARHQASSDGVSPSCFFCCLHFPILCQSAPLATRQELSQKRQTGPGESIGQSTTQRLSSDWTRRLASRLSSRLPNVYRRVDCPSYSHLLGIRAGEQAKASKVGIVPPQNTIPTFPPRPHHATSESLHPWKIKIDVVTPSPTSPISDFIHLKRKRKVSMQVRQHQHQPRPNQPTKHHQRMQSAQVAAHTHK